MPDPVCYCNTFRYEIKCYDINQKRVESIWKRDYKPVLIPDINKGKYEFGGIVMGSNRGKAFKFKTPPRNDFPDIQRIFIVGGHIWVITSTIDSKKGVLVDIFDQKGRYSDHFYLLLPTGLNVHYLYRSPISISSDGNHLVVRERDEEDNFKVVEYRIIDDA
ncbi:MAG: hypothetical protein GY940_40245 [bacterium]|nr:hypothetical protein [bacterium]